MCFLTKKKSFFRYVIYCIELFHCRNDDSVIMFGILAILNTIASSVTTAVAQL